MSVLEVQYLTEGKCLISKHDELERQTRIATTHKQPLHFSLNLNVT